MRAGDQRQNQYGNRRYDLENQYDYTFDDTSVRNRFIRKVLSIVLVQLIFSFGVICLFLFCDPVAYFALTNPWLLWVAFGVTIVTMMALACCESVRRQFPINLIMLILFTIAKSFLLGVLALLYYPELVFMAVGITAVVVLALTVFAIQTKIDFTTCSGIFIAGFVILLVAMIVVFFIPTKTTMLIYSSLAVFFLSIYLVYDIQVLMGGRTNEISEEDYVFAALSLYVDIINLFMHILIILGLLDD